jgi:hypothetical protein
MSDQPYDAADLTNSNEGEMRVTLACAIAFVFAMGTGVVFRLLAG